MCGRYHVDNHIFENILKDLGIHVKEGEFDLRERDIQPGDKVLVLLGLSGQVTPLEMIWGYRSFDKKLVFNTRAESAAEKTLFRQDIVSRRIAVPATLFYEWNTNKEKNTFTRMDHKEMYFAGIYTVDEKGDYRFSIITTAANASMQKVHDRMPLILEKDQIADWIFNSDKTEDILSQKPVELERESEYEQLSLF